MRPTLRLALQRVWHATEPACDLAIKWLPNTVKLILFRALAKELRVNSVTVSGEFGEFQGNPFDLGVISEYMLSETYSPELMKFLGAWFNRFGHGTMIDVGANIGLTAIPLAMTGIDCICFEPDAENFKLLQNNVQRHTLSGSVRLFNLAIFDSDTDVDFEISDWNHGDHRVRVVGAKGAFGEQHRVVKKVAARRLDGMLGSEVLRRPLFVKIDTQGGEAHALIGGETVVSSADLLSLEFCPYLLRRAGKHENILIDFVEKYFAAGYIENWHSHSQKRRLLKIDELVSKLRSFSRTVNTTEHLDLLLVRDPKFAENII